MYGLDGYQKIMKQLLTELEITDDDYMEYGGDNLTLVKNIVGEELYYHGRVGFELMFINRDWNRQTQTVQIFIMGNYRDLLWFRLKYTPKIHPFD